MASPNRAVHPLCPPPPSLPPWCYPSEVLLLPLTLNMLLLCPAIFYSPQDPSHVLSHSICTSNLWTSGGGWFAPRSMAHKWIVQDLNLRASLFSSYHGLLNLTTSQVTYTDITNSSERQGWPRKQARFQCRKLPLSLIGQLSSYKNYDAKKEV